jgi:hypothetical protein
MYNVSKCKNTLLVTDLTVIMVWMASTVPSSRLLVDTAICSQDFGFFHPLVQAPKVTSAAESVSSTLKSHINLLDITAKKLQVLSTTTKL